MSEHYLPVVQKTQLEMTIRKILSRCGQRRIHATTSSARASVHSRCRPRSVSSASRCMGRPPSARLRNRCASLPDVWRADASSVRHHRSDRGESDPPMSIAAAAGPATGIGEGRRTSPRSGRGRVARRGSQLRLRSVSAVRRLGEQTPNDELRSCESSDPPQGRSARPARSGQGRRPSRRGTGAAEA